MFKFSTTIDYEPYDYPVSHNLKLEQNTVFKFGDCIFKYYKDELRSFSAFCLNVTYFSQDSNKEKASKRIVEHIHGISFIFNVPLDCRNIFCSEGKEITQDKNVTIFSYNKSRKKSEKIQSIGNQIKSLDKKVKNKLFYYFNLLNQALIQDLKYGHNEYSFFNLFRILESISKLEFEKDGNTISINMENFKEVLKNIINNDLKLEISNNKLSDISNKLAKDLKENATNGVSSKIIYCKNKYNIDINCEELDKAKKIRDRIAHSLYVDEDSEEFKNSYSLISHLIQQLIPKIYFNSIYKDVHIGIDIY